MSVKLACELRELIAEQERQLAVAENILATLESRKDSTERLSKLECLSDTHDRLVEESVTLAVAEHLQQASVIIPFRYEFEGQQGGLAGLVQGIHKGEEVIVFIAAKHNMNCRWRRTKSELLGAHMYWEKLSKVEAQDLFVDKSLLADYVTLFVEESRNNKAMFAVGGHCDTFDKSKFQDLHLECIYVVTDTHEDCVATVLT